LRASGTTGVVRTSPLARLTGRPGGVTPDLPAGLLPGLRRLAESIDRDSGELGDRVVVDPVAVACERAVAARLTRNGDVSCGGACRLLPTVDHWVAVSLPRPGDWELTAAWLELGTPVDDGRWDLVAAPVSEHRGGELVERAVLLGMAVAVVGERVTGDLGSPVMDGAVAGIAVRDVGPGDPEIDVRQLSVVDLSSLWAGPLAGSLLRRAGARVVKVESTTRPDGARSGPESLFRSLNDGKESVTFDFTSSSGRRELQDLVSRADAVITSARPRALEQLGLDPAAMVGAGGPAVWLAITGYGDGPGAAGRVAFGDDAAAAGGLVVWDDDGPCFCADAVADPATGLAGAAAVLAVLASGRRAVVVASMADVAGGLA
jgi:hypothetical protein